VKGRQGAGQNPGSEADQNLEVSDQRRWCVRGGWSFTVRTLPSEALVRDGHMGHRVVVQIERNPGGSDS